MPSSATVKQFTALVEIMARLRGLGGCPWDQKQTHTSLKEYLLEETYEVLEALDEQDSKKLCQELGDLLLQIIFHARIAEESGEFTMEDVLKGINTKLERRHPHIFGSIKAETPEEVSHNWEAIKQGERGEVSILSTVPRQMPALAYSKDIQRRVAQVGFDWKDINGVIEKLSEEVAEFQQAEDRENKIEEFGDLLFTLVNIVRRQDIDAEDALRQANKKFYRRFTYMEEICRQRGINLGDLSFEEQNALWDAAKKKT